MTDHGDPMNLQGCDPPLDNPIWSALVTRHKGLARRHGLAARFPDDVSPLAGLQVPIPQAFDDLLDLVGTESRVALFTAGSVMPPATWTVQAARLLDQMVCLDPPQSSLAANIVTLTPADVPQMLTLTALTQPGPFLPATIRTGRYIGVRDADGLLIAMAGQRLSLTDFTEISAVCTHPDARGHGHAATLVKAMTAMIAREGRTAFLHVKSDNGAREVYRKCGFTLRRTVNLTVVRRV